jgi:hypothetical protein
MASLRLDVGSDLFPTIVTVDRGIIRESGIFDQNTSGFHRKTINESESILLIDLVVHDDGVCMGPIAIEFEFKSPKFLKSSGVLICIEWSRTSIVDDNWSTQSLAITQQYPIGIDRFDLGVGKDTESRIGRSLSKYRIEMRGRAGAIGYRNASGAISDSNMITRPA